MMSAPDEPEGTTGVEPSKSKLCCSARLLFCMTCFIAMSNVAYVRASVGMALVCMVASNKTLNVEHLDRKLGEFTWSSTFVGYLISATFYGFIAGPFISGFLSFKFGGKIIIIIGMVAMGCTNLLLPEATRINSILFFVLRVFTGFFASFLFPAFYDLVRHWIPSEETQLLVTGVLVGVPVGNILNFPISGGICNWLGWVWLFYSLGIWLIFFGITVHFIIYNYPEQCPYIRINELNYLKSQMKTRGKYKIPWKAIFKSLPIYAYLVIHYSSVYVYLTMVFAVPIFLAQNYHISLEHNGFLSALPFIGSLIVRILVSLFYERLRLRLKLSKNTIRKICVFIGSTLSIIFLFIVTFLSLAHEILILSCLIFSLCCLELCVTGGYLLSLLDLCPTYVNIMTGMVNTVANSAGLINPVITGYLTPGGKKEEWNNVFYLNAALIIFSMTFYLIFGQNSLQPWGSGIPPTRP